MRPPPAVRARVERRQIEIGDADLAGHQLVQQRLEQVFEHRALALVQVDLAVDGVEDRDDLALFVESWAQESRTMLKIRDVDAARWSSVLVLSMCCP